MQRIMFFNFEEFSWLAHRCDFQNRHIFGNKVQAICILGLR